MPVFDRYTIYPAQDISNIISGSMMQRNGVNSPGRDLLKIIVELVRCTDTASGKVSPRDVYYSRWSSIAFP